MNRILLNSSLAASMAFAAFGCESNGSSPSPSAEPSMSTTLSALEAALNECKEQRDACQANLADASVDRSCQEAFVACKRGAIDGAMPDISKNVNTCAEEARTCREAAADDAAREACREDLRTCLDARGSGKPERDSDAKVDEADDQPGNSGDHGKPDGGANGDHASPVAACTGALHDCIDGDKPAKECTDALRACLETTLPNHANGQDDRPDAGKADQDHGNMGGGDRGQSGEHKPADAGVGGGDRPEKPERDGGRGKPQA